MSELARVKDLFGQIDRLDTDVAWTAGLADMFGWLTWNTRALLGVSKTEYWKLAVEWALEGEPEGVRAAAKKRIARRFAAEAKSNNAEERYARPRSGIVGALEASRRARYFSEDYLNKEFDIFMSLASDRFLHSFYKPVFDHDGVGAWFTHGNGSLFAASFELTQMQMDNLAYCPEAKILVANELKLGGRKNADQLLKYGWLFHKLKDNGLVPFDCRLALLFIGASAGDFDVQRALREEIAKCTRQGRKVFLHDSVRHAAEGMEVKSISWAEVIRAIEDYAAVLPSDRQVERKLLKGFVESLLQKAPIREAQLHSARVGTVAEAGD